MARKFTPGSSTPLCTTALRVKPVVNSSSSGRASRFVGKLAAVHVGHDDVGEQQRDLGMRLDSLRSASGAVGRVHAV